MTNTKHTPAPWEETSRDIISYIGGESIYIARAFSNGEPQLGWTNPGCSSIEAKANARFIVKAVNCHDELLAFAELVAAGHLTRQGFVDAAQRVVAKAKGE